MQLNDHEFVKTLKTFLHCRIDCYDTQCLLEGNLPIAVAEIDTLHKLFKWIQYTGLLVDSIY